MHINLKTAPYGAVCINTGRIIGMNQATLGYCVIGQEVLLGMKKRGFGAGKWNGYGGKVQVGESIAKAFLRELSEESGLTATESSLEQIAYLEFFFLEKPIFACTTFVLHSWSGKPQETDEMLPKWFSIDSLPRRRPKSLFRSWSLMQSRSRKFASDTNGRSAKTAPGISIF